MVMPKIQIKIGDTFGKLTIVKELDPIVSNQNKKLRMLRCRCVCKTILDIRLTYLVNFNKTSCGCDKIIISKVNIIPKTRKYRKSSLPRKKFKPTFHGLSKHPLYIILNCMNNRCFSDKNMHYADYGGRGITVCKEWLIGAEGIKNFIAWNESLPKEQRWQKGLQIDRINNDGNYEPSNCRWATCKEQQSNTRKVNMKEYPVEYKGKQYKLLYFYEKYHDGTVSFTLACRRIRSFGMSPFKAVSKPSQRHSK